MPSPSRHRYSILDNSQSTTAVRAESRVEERKNRKKDDYDDSDQHEVGKDSPLVRRLSLCTPPHIHSNDC